MQPPAMAQEALYSWGAIKAVYTAASRSQKNERSLLQR